jgi:uncharacterized membrane protein YgcG
MVAAITVAAVAISAAGVTSAGAVISEAAGVTSEHIRFGWIWRKRGYPRKRWLRTFSELVVSFPIKQGLCPAVLLEEVKPMLLRIYRPALILAAVGFLAAGGTATASAIKDEGRVFSAQVKEQAERDLEGIAHLYNKEVIIEMVPSVPEGNWWSRFKKWMLYSKDPKNRRRFYEDWAKRSARAAGPNSLYVLIVKEPAPLHVEIAAGLEAQKKDGVTPADSKRLQARLQTLFQKGNYDAGLEETVKELGRTLRDNRDAATVPPEQFPWAELGSLMAIMLGAWLCLQLMQKFLGNRDPERALPLAEAGYGTGSSYLAGLYATLTGGGLQELFRTLRSREARLHESVVWTKPASSDDREVLLTDADVRDSHRHADEPHDYIHDNP